MFKLCAKEASRPLRPKSYLPAGGQGAHSGDQGPGAGLLPVGAGMVEVLEKSRILIADDHPLFREALHQVVTAAFAEPEGPLAAHECVEADSLDLALSRVGEEDFDLILLDLNMPGMEGFAGLVALRNHAPATPIIVVSAEDSREAVQDSIAFGASGFIPKSLPKERMAQAIRDVLAGEVYLPADLAERASGRSSSEGNDPELAARLATLTQQQRCVLEMLVTGKSNKVIAYELDIAESTVKAHVSAILRKLKVHNRTQAVIDASRILGKLREGRAPSP